MVTHRSLPDIVRDVLDERFGDIRIDSVRVEHDVDADGDPIVRIRVVLEDDGIMLDPRRASGLVRHMRPRLAEEGVEGFPILSFVSRSDLGKARPEAL